MLQSTKAVKLNGSPDPLPPIVQVPPPPPVIVAEKLGELIAEAPPSVQLLVAVKEILSLAMGVKASSSAKEESSERPATMPDPTTVPIASEVASAWASVPAS